MDVLVDRCAGLDVHKDTVMAAIRRPTADGRGREQEIRQYRTFTAALRELRAWLVAERVTQVAMEATGSYWKPVWHVLEAEGGYELLLCNAQHVKNVRGRKTDVLRRRLVGPAGRVRPAAGQLRADADDGPAA